MRIIRIHLNLHAISHEHANVMEPHFAGNISENGCLVVVEQHPKHRSFECFNNRSFLYFLFFVLCHHGCHNLAIIAALRQNVKPAHIISILYLLFPWGRSIKKDDTIHNGYKNHGDNEKGVIVHKS